MDKNQTKHEEKIKNEKNEKKTHGQNQRKRKEKSKTKSIIWKHVENTTKESKMKYFKWKQRTESEKTPGKNQNQKRIQSNENTWTKWKKPKEKIKKQ